jgi:predicted nucleic acid-binding protein
MIVIDTNALVGLVDSSDELHPQAAAHFARLGRQELCVTGATLAEAVHLLPLDEQRKRLWGLLQEFDIGMSPIPDSNEVWEEVFEWLNRYAEHSPDWADGLLAVMSSRDKRLRVWSYDEEFRTIWRRKDGGRIPMAVDL